MDRDGEEELNERLPLADLQAVFDQKPVTVAICFGSQATGAVHDQSDVDLAIELDDVQPDDETYNETFFAIHTAVAETLDRDDVDLVDIQSVSGSLARSIFETGTVIYGDPERAEKLRDQIDTEREKRSPRDRLDSAIERIEEHLA